jgi:hypothetical protein
MRSVRPTTCPDCGANTLTGPDSDRAAINQTIDPWPITRDAQLLAIILERPLYELNRAGHLYRRPPRRALNHNPQSFTVHAAHHCHQPLPAAPPATPASDPHDPPF